LNATAFDQDERCERVLAALDRIEGDEYITDPPPNAEQLRERNAKLIAHWNATHCVNCGLTEREHLGPDKICPRRPIPPGQPHEYAATVPILYWTPGRPASAP